MRVSDTQVERSIAALRRLDRRGDSAPASPRLGPGDLPAGLADLLAGLPIIRLDVVEAARARLAKGDQPSADAVAGTVVGRLVCDRLR